MANPVPGVVPGAPSSRNYEGGFAAELMLKDLKLAAETGREVGAKLDFVDRTVEVYEAALARGEGKKDFSVVFQDKRKGGR